jgi:hypothetical protein
MTDEGFDRVLRLVAEGRLTADEAAPILDALAARSAVPGGATAAPADEPAGRTDAQERRGVRFARIEVREGGRRVVDLRIPTSLGRFALNRVPGLSTDQISQLEQAITSGALGPILDVEDTDGDGVRIVLE